MRISFDITQAVKREGRGIARYIRSVCPLLANEIPGLEARFCIRADRWRSRSLVADMAPLTTRHWLPIPAWMTIRGLQLFHSFGNHLPAVCRVPRTFTIHDFRKLDMPGSGRSLRLHRNIDRADGIICLTEHGRSRLLEHFPEFNSACVAVIPHGVDHKLFYPRDPFQVAKTVASIGLDEPFLLQLGGWFPHKNLELSIRAFARSQALANGYRLVFVGGGSNSGYLGKLWELAETEGVGEQITWIENAEDNILPVVLNAASCLLQPSKYEGFALPLLEAMASGTPGVVSNSSCLPEVSGGIWPVAGQDDVEAFTAGIDAMTMDDAARTAAIHSGLERAGQFTWAATSKAMAAFFQRVLEEVK